MLGNRASLTKLCDEVVAGNIAMDDIVNEAYYKEDSDHEAVTSTSDTSLSANQASASVSSYYS